MPTRKISDGEWYPITKAPCRHPEHTPPCMQVFEDGIYKHTCPACGYVTIFRVRDGRLL